MQTRVPITRQTNGSRVSDLSVSVIQKLICCLLLFLLAGCATPTATPLATQPATAEPAITPTATRPSPSPTRTTASEATFTPLPTRTDTPRPTVARWTKTPTPTPTATGFVPAFNPVFPATPLPAADEPISAANLPRLALTGLWGKGTIRNVAFSPTGETFVVGSAFGIAEYSLDALDGPPRWLPFDHPTIYPQMVFSPDGQFLLLESHPTPVAFDLITGQFESSVPNLDWVRPPSIIEGGFDCISVISPDGTRRFSGGLKYVSLEDVEFDDIQDISEDAAVAEVYDTASGELLYDLSAGLPYVRYSDRNSPEGCDLNVFSPCGNALMASAMTPYRAAFSPSNGTLAVLYRAPNLGSTNRFSMLRLYQAEDGKLRRVFGSFQQPVEDFAFSPDGIWLVVGYTDGTIELWDVRSDFMAYHSVDFTDELEDAALTPDGAILLLKYRDEVQMLLAQDGTRLRSFPASAFALSPDGTRLAIGTRDGRIDVYQVFGNEVTHLAGHRETVYSLAFSPDGQRLASSGQDCAIRYWDAAEGQSLHVFESVTADPYESPDLQSRIFVYSLGFVPDTNQIIGFGSWGTVASWNPDTGAAQFVVPSAPLDFYQGMMTIKPHFPEWFGVDVAGNRFMINDSAYDLKTGAALGEIASPQNAPAGCAVKGELSKDSRLLFTRGYDNYYGRICVLDATTMHLLESISVIPHTDRDYLGPLWPILSPDGKTLYFPTQDGAVMVYQVGEK